ncbi:MAG: hypothetical protein AABX89_03840 [Candidatus Thermoplasmatota archaeon]
MGDVLGAVWYGRSGVVEVAKAEVDAWGYDVVLSHADTTRYVQLKTKPTSDVHRNLFARPGACVVVIIPSLDGASRRYRFLELHDRLAMKLPPATYKKYRRGSTVKDERGQHVKLHASLFGPPMDAMALTKALFP